MGFLTGKRVLVTGLASRRSIAYGIADAMHKMGAELTLTYQGDRLRERVEKMAEQWDSDRVFPCDVSSDDAIADLFSAIRERWDYLDVLVHSLAYAPAALLEGDYLEKLTRDGFSMAHDISSYSFAALAKAAIPLMEGRNGSLLTMTYLGSMRTIPNYNVMGVAKASLEANVRYMANSLGPKGIRVNAISAGPIRTLAASGISGFRKMLDYQAQVSPLRRNVTIEEVGNVSAFLCSDLASGITGDIVYVDAGYHSMGMGIPEN